ncbi:hypothetical protein KGQ34_02330 [Patescibacteria group bacterium]|nr:hypothetical protein [Patescibacteria group bacterium]
MNFALAREAQEALKKTTRWQRFCMKMRGKKLYLGCEQKEGWSGKLPFYLFWCSACEHYAKDYPHGFIERQYLICSYCGQQQDFVSWRAPFTELRDLVLFFIRHRREFFDRRKN